MKGREFKKNPKPDHVVYGWPHRLWFTIIFFDRPCSQIDEEIEDDDETSSSSLGGSGGNSGLEDDSEMTYVNTLETKQVFKA